MVNSVPVWLNGIWTSFVANWLYCVFYCRGLKIMLWWASEGWYDGSLHNSVLMGEKRGYQFPYINLNAKYYIEYKCLYKTYNTLREAFHWHPLILYIQLHFTSQFLLFSSYSVEHEEELTLNGISFSSCLPYSC